MGDRKTRAVGTGCIQQKTPALKTASLEALLWYVLLTLSFMVLLQSYRELVSSVYFYALVELGLTPHILVLSIFISPILAHPISRAAGWRTSVMVSGTAALLTRLPLGLGLEQPFHLVFSALSFLAVTILLSLLFALHRRERCSDPDLFSSQGLAGSFAISILALIVLSIPGRGVDVSLVPGAPGVMVSPSLSALLCGTMAASLFMLRKSRLFDSIRGEGGEPGEELRGGAADSWSPGLGLGAALFLSAAVLAQPLVTSSWLGTPYPMAVSFSVVVVTLFVLSLLTGPGWLMTLRRTLAHPKYAIASNVILIVGAANIFILRFPVQVAPAVVTWIMLVDVWVILDALTDSAPFSGQDEGAQKEGAPLGRRFQWNRTRSRRSPLLFSVQMTIACSGLILLTMLLSISDQWSFVPFGELFKGAAPAIYTASAVVVGLSGFLCSKASIHEPYFSATSPIQATKGSPTVDAGRGTGHIRRRGAVSPRLRTQWLQFGSTALALMLVSMGFTIALHSNGPERRRLGEDGIIRVASYNIHHGFSNDGVIDPTPHLDVLKDIDADIILLQESRSLLPAEGSFDPAVFLAGRLGMHLARGGGPWLGDEGLAVLSRFELKELKTYRMPSDDIQRAAMALRVDMGGRSIWVMNVHFGLEAPERAEQIEWVANKAENLSMDAWKGLPFIIGGDLNTEPRDPIMGRINSTAFGGMTWNASYPSLELESPWHSVPESGRNRDMDHHTFPTSAYDLKEEHIDYILLSDGLEPIEAWIGDGEDASDHRPIWADVKVL